MKSKKISTKLKLGIIALVLFFISVGITFASLSVMADYVYCANKCLMKYGDVNEWSQACFWGCINR